jgi:hypothetical protein
MMVQPFAEGKVTSEAVNQSLPGLLTRLLTHHPSFVTRGEEAYIPTEYHNIAELDERSVQWLVRACFGVFAALVMWRCRTPTDDRGSWRLLAEFSVVILGMLLFSERTWKHHCVTLLLPFAVLCYCVSALRWPRRRKWYLGVTIAAAFGLIMLTGTTGLSARQDRFGDMAQVYGAYVWAFLLLLTAMLVLLDRQLFPSARRAATMPASPALPPEGASHVHRVLACPLGPGTPHPGRAHRETENHARHLSDERQRPGDRLQPEVEP